MIPGFNTAMSDVQRIGNSLPLIDLTNDNVSSSNHMAQYSNITRNDNRGANRSPELIDLTEDDNQYFTSNIPVIDLTGDDDQFFSYRIPVIDLTDDDVQEITHQTQCIDLTHDSSSSNTIQNFGGIRDEGTKLTTKLNDLTANVEDINPNLSIVDLTCDNDQFINRRIEDIEMTDVGDIQNLTDLLHSLDLTNGKQQNINDCIPEIDLANHGYQSIDQIHSVTDPIRDEECKNDKISVIDKIPSDDTVVRKPVDDAEMNDLSCIKPPISFYENVVKNNLRTRSGIISYDEAENDSLKSNEASSMNLMHTGTFSSMQKLHVRKETILANNLPKNHFESKTEAISTNHSSRNNLEGKKESNATNHLLTSNFESRKETPLTNPQTSNLEERYLSPGDTDRISQDDSLDFLKPARRPIPLRHSFGRSTVNTSPNVPIECTESSEEQSHTLTVSSIIRRKKSKQSSGFSKRNLLEPSEPTTSRENTLPFETSKASLLKFWIFLLLIFMGLYYLIFVF